ncbi:MAG: hypothetical protein JO332_14855 [Planctomycetaceae bacterium]|nr:hypothetical protein [Planctomycetaceae bacterium]
MADRIKVFPLAVLGALALFGLLVWWAIARSKAQEARIPGPDEPIVDMKPPPAGTPQGTKIQSAPSPSVEAPPPARDPGEKILEGADRAYDTGYYETALMFYKDFELRYAGTETYDRHAIRVFERIHTSAAKMPKKDETLPAYVDARRKAADDWKRLKPLMAAAPTDATRAELKKYLDSLPPRDGRRAPIEAWLGGEK